MHNRPVRASECFLFQATQCTSVKPVTEGGGEDQITKTMLAKYQDSVPLISKPAIGHYIEPFPFICLSQ